MNELVVCTTFKREELLFLALEAIRRDDVSIPIYVFSDRGQCSADLAFVVAHWGALLTVREPHAHYGNSWNLFEACRGTLAEQSLLGIVHLIEDDTVIHRGWLDWARYELSTGVPAAVCARICAPSRISGWYSSLAASWSASDLRVALQHLVPEYFADSRMAMRQIVDEKIFPASRYRKGGAEQDGFLLRAIEYHRWITKSPTKPMATHLGFYGYNHAARAGPTGTLDQRIAFCRELLRDKRRRAELFGKNVTEMEMAAWDGQT